MEKNNDKQFTITLDCLVEEDDGKWHVEEGGKE